VVEKDQPAWTGELRRFAHNQRLLHCRKRAPLIGADRVPMWCMAAGL
jgi:hypothetical protein